MTDTQVKQALTECGEMERWDRQTFPESLAEVRANLNRTLRTTPPSDDHVRLHRALLELE